MYRVILKKLVVIKIIILRQYWYMSRIVAVIFIKRLTPTDIHIFSTTTMSTVTDTDSVTPHATEYREKIKEVLQPRCDSCVPVFARPQRMSRVLVVFFSRHSIPQVISRVWLYVYNFGCGTYFVACVRKIDFNLSCLVF